MSPGRGRWIDHNTDNQTAIAPKNQSRKSVNS
jgi:hypothetical protein